MKVLLFLSSRSIFVERTVKNKQNRCLQAEMYRKIWMQMKCVMVEIQNEEELNLSILGTVFSVSCTSASVMLERE
ncbi:hypothetical protein NPIL_187411 [Nephila pilipes]|uniref:Uncharacterized protein n=1 Tax=Nephila pilipes TaxID=299642 RepID=A0A8X6TF27_NEPPI|nr:hypothetical protein NPIL_187411 [Nephila pilipes]